MKNSKENMTEQEVKNYIDELTEGIVEELGEAEPDMESVKDTVGMNVLYKFTHDEMSEEDFLACVEYLGISKDEIDMNLVREIKAKREKEAEYRRNYKEKKKRERLAKKKLTDYLKNPNREASKEEYDKLVELVEDYLESMKRAKEAK